MLTSDQLAAIKAHCTHQRVNLPTGSGHALRCYIAPVIDLDALIAEMNRLERLQILYREALDAIRIYLVSDQNIGLCSCDKCTNIRIKLDAVDIAEKQC